MQHHFDEDIHAADDELMTGLGGCVQYLLMMTAGAVGRMSSIRHRR